MSIEYMCPGCHERFHGVTDEDSCPACLEPLQPIKTSPAADARLLCSDELTGPQRAIDKLMRRNCGVRVE